MGIISPVATDANGNEIATGSLKELGKDDFLQLLITKMTHQDPLDPMDDEAFIADLAQFSSLEQMSNINESLSESLNWDYLQMQTINNTMATSLIGKDVEATFSGVYLDSDNTPMIGYTTTQYADKVTITISDINGSVVRTITEEDVAAGSNTIVWDGKDDDGERLDDGYYQVEISAIDASGGSFDPSTFIQGRVDGVVYRDGSAYLKVGGLEIPLSGVNSISESDENEG
nr:hypothetical protein [candidate division Zixibacteria bacterium]